MRYPLQPRTWCVSDGQFATHPVWVACMFMCPQPGAALVRCVQHPMTQGSALCAAWDVHQQPRGLLVCNTCVS
jgi:hypothetical protein